MIPICDSRVMDTSVAYMSIAAGRPRATVRVVIPIQAYRLSWL